MKRVISVVCLIVLVGALCLSCMQVKADSKSSSDSFWIKALIGKYSDWPNDMLVAKDKIIVVGTFTSSKDFPNDSTSRKFISVLDSEGELKEMYCLTKPETSHSGCLRKIVKLNIEKIIQEEEGYLILATNFQHECGDIINFSEIYLLRLDFAFKIKEVKAYKFNAWNVVQFLKFQDCYYLVCNNVGEGIPALQKSQSAILKFNQNLEVVAATMFVFQDGWVPHGWLVPVDTQLFFMGGLDQRLNTSDYNEAFIGELQEQNLSFKWVKTYGRFVDSTGAGVYDPQDNCLILPIENYRHEGRFPYHYLGYLKFDLSGNILEMKRWDIESWPSRILYDSFSQNFYLVCSYRGISVLKLNHKLEPLLFTRIAPQLSSVTGKLITTLDSSNFIAVMGSAAFPEENQIAPEDQSSDIVVMKLDSNLKIPYGTGNWVYDLPLPEAFEITNIKPTNRKIPQQNLSISVLSKPEFQIEKVDFSLLTIKEVERNSYKIAISWSAGGEVLPADSIITWNGSITYTFVPEEGYEIEKVRVDGQDLGPLSSYTFSQVKANHSLEVYFKKKIIKKILIQLTIGSNNMYLNGARIEMDVSPLIIEDRTLLPIRWLAEPLGATVNWDSSLRKVTVSLKNTIIELWIGKNIAKVNGVETPIDSNNPKVVPIIINSRTMLPLRFISENLGCTVTWDNITKTVTIIYYP